MHTTHPAPPRGRLTLHALALAATAVLLALIAVLGLGGATAQAATGDHFTCRSAPLSVQGLQALAIEPTIANDPNDPCAIDSDTLVTLPALLRPILDLTGVTASTEVTGSSAAASADVAETELLPIPLIGGIRVGALESRAAYSCVAGQPVASSSSQVASLGVPGRTFGVIDTPLRVDVPLLASIRLNATETSASSVTQRAVDIQLLPLVLGGIRIVLGETTAGVVGNPCPPVVVPPTPRPPIVPTPRTPVTPTTPTTPTTPVEPPTDISLHPPVIDDGPPSRTPSTDAVFLYHGVDQGAALECRLDGGAWSACNGRSSFSGLAPGQHCFDVRAKSATGFGPTTRYCWTVTASAAGCTATNRHGYFVKAGSAALGNRQAVFHATTNSRAGQIALVTRSGPGVLDQVGYTLNGRALGSGGRATLRYAQLDRTKTQTLRVDVRGNGRRNTITRRFRYVNYVALACDSRRVVGAIAARTVALGSGSVTVKSEVPSDIRGTAKLRFTAAPSRRHQLRSVSFALDGRPVSHHLRSAVFTAKQLKADGTQTLTVRLVSKDGTTRTVRIPFRTIST